MLDELIGEIMAILKTLDTSRLHIVLGFVKRIAGKF